MYIMGEYGKLHFFGHFFINKAHETQFSRGMEQTLKTQKVSGKVRMYRDFAHFFGNGLWEWRK